MIACALGLLGFAAAIVAGLVAGNPAITTLWRALLAMAGCYLAGSAIGKVTEYVLSEHIAQYKRAYPLESAGRPSNDTAEAETENPASEAQETPGEPASDSNRRDTDQRREAASTDEAPPRAATAEHAAA
jgi:hypothetical protein